MPKFKDQMVDRHTWNEPVRVTTSGFAYYPKKKTEREQWLSPVFYMIQEWVIAL